MWARRVRGSGIQMSSWSGTWKDSRVGNFRGLWFQNFGGSLAGSWLPETCLRNWLLHRGPDSRFSLSSPQCGWGCPSICPRGLSAGTSRALPMPSLVECSQAPGPSSDCSSITACPTLFLLLARHHLSVTPLLACPAFLSPCPGPTWPPPQGMLTSDRLGLESLTCHSQDGEQPCRASVSPSTQWG